MIKDFPLCKGFLRIESDGVREGDVAWRRRI